MIDCLISLKYVTAHLLSLFTELVNMTCDLSVEFVTLSITSMFQSALQTSQTHSSYLINHDYQRIWYKQFWAHEFKFLGILVTITRIFTMEMFASKKNIIDQYIIIALHDEILEAGFGSLLLSLWIFQKLANAEFNKF